MKTLDKAIARYFAVVGDAAIQPDNALSTIAPNGTAFLRNVNGNIAVVTSKGHVFDRIGGERMDIQSGEPGIFRIVSGSYSSGSQNLDVFLRGHSGSAMRIERGGRPIHRNTGDTNERD